MMKLPLNQSANATFVDDGTGTGGTVARAQLSPQVFGVTWYVKRIVISTTSSGINGSSRFFMYLNNESPAALIDGTYSGDQDVSETELELQTLDRLIFVWVGGDLNSIGTVLLTGTMETGRRH